MNFVTNPPPLWNSTYCGWFVLCTNLIHVYFRYCSKASLIDFMAFELLPEINWKLKNFEKIEWNETLTQVRIWHRFFPVNFAKFLRTPFLQNTSGRLLLRVVLWMDANVCDGTFCKELFHIICLTSSKIPLWKFASKQDNQYKQFS